MNKRLYAIVEYILNIADPEDLEVIKAALDKRLDDNRRSPVLGLNPAKMAEHTGDAINAQLDATRESVRKMAVDLAAGIIRQNAPELDEDQVQQLLSDFMPESAGGKPSEKGQRADSAPGGDLPAGMIVQMVQQFLDYSAGIMSPAEQVQLENEVPGWKDRYWRSFPGTVQKLISLYLNGEIDRSRFDAHLYEVLGL